MKKIASLFIALIMLLSLSVTAFANEREVVIGTVHTNEYDYIVAFIDDIEVPGSYYVFIENSGEDTETVNGDIAVKKR